jgi:hypothetical protein
MPVFVHRGCCMQIEQTCTALGLTSAEGEELECF